MVHSRILPEYNPSLSQTESETETEAATVEQSNVDIITPSEILNATQFPFVLDMIELKRTNDDDEGSEELSHLKITVRNGTLGEMETYPGLWVQASAASTSSSSRTRTEAIITGISIELLKLCSLSTQSYVGLIGSASSTQYQICLECTKKRRFESTTTAQLLIALWHNNMTYSMDRIQYGNTEPHSGCQFKLIIQNAHKMLALVFSSWQGTHSQGWDQCYCCCNKVHCWGNVYCNIYCRRLTLVYLKYDRFLEH